MQRMGAWAAGSAAVATAVGAVVAGATAARLSAPMRPRQTFGFTPFEVGVDAEDVRFESAHGVQLAGWWMDDPDADLAVIVCHGHRGSKADLLGIGPGLHRTGRSVLLVDFRGGGESSDGPQSLAHYEKQDVLAAVDWVQARRPDLPVVVVGFSMGASAALLEAVDDARVRALVLDSPFASLTQVVADAYRRFRLPAGPLVPLADLATRLGYGYRFGDVRPVDVIGRIDRPLLLIHGREDRTIPVAHAEALARAAQPDRLQFVVVDGVEHCGAYFADRPGYIARVASFLDRVDTPG